MKAMHLPLHSWRVGAQAKEVQPCLTIEWAATPIVAVLDQDGQLRHQIRVDHEPGAIQAFLENLLEGTPVARETVANWYWIGDEIEAAGCWPLLAHTAKAKVMTSNINKTDKIDATGLAKPVHLDSLPAVWLPPGEFQDARELHRTRMALS
jgi:hypothetical protein